MAPATQSAGFAADVEQSAIGVKDDSKRPNAIDVVEREPVTHVVKFHHVMGVFKIVPGPNAPVGEPLVCLDGWEFHRLLYPRAVGLGG